MKTSKVGKIRDHPEVIWQKISKGLDFSTLAFKVF